MSHIWLDGIPEISRYDMLEERIAILQRLLAGELVRANIRHVIIGGLDEEVLHAHNPRYEQFLITATAAAWKQGLQPFDVRCYVAWKGRRPMPGSTITSNPEIRAALGYHCDYRPIMRQIIAHDWSRLVAFARKLFRPTPVT